MRFSLATPEDSKKILSNAIKAKIYLTTGVVEIFEKHQDLLGKVDINLVEVETNQENKQEKFTFIVHDALVIVSNKGLNSEIISETGVYIFAKRVLEVTSNFTVENISLEDFSKKVELKLTKLEGKKQYLLEPTISNLDFEKTKTDIIILEDELNFEKRVIAILKQLRS
jgi:hypothetical protein